MINNLHFCCRGIRQLNISVRLFYALTPTQTLDEDSSRSYGVTIGNNTDSDLRNDVSEKEIGHSTDGRGVLNTVDSGGYAS